MHTVRLNIQDNVYSHIMFLLKSLNSKDIEIINAESTSNTAKDINYENWTQEEIARVGKIGFSSQNFVEDEEDYSKWIVKNK